MRYRTFAGSDLTASAARTAFVCNTTTQPGQTDGMDVVAHVREVVRYLGDCKLDYVLLNIQVPREEMLAAYREDQVHFMPVTPEEVRRVKALGPIPVVGNFVEEGWRGKRALHKLDTIRHDPHKVATALRTLVADGRDRQRGAEQTGVTPREAA